MSAEQPAIPIWHCDLKNAERLTVGQPFDLNCSGDIAVTWSSTHPRIVQPEKTPPYSLVILSAKKLESTRADFVVTSYRTGEMKPEYIRVIDGEAGFEASALNWKVQSVLKQGEQPKPYGPVGPFQLPMPMWIWIVVAVILASVSSALWIWFRRVQDRRRLAADLGQHASAVMSPAAQFHKELRTLSRKLIHAKDTAEIGEWTAALDQAVRVYLMLEFQFLTLRVPRWQISSTFKRKNRLAYDEFSGGLEKIFSEMDRFLTHAKSHKPEEFEQILTLARQWCDRVEKSKRRQA